MITVDWQHIILAASGYAGTSRRIARMRASGARFPLAYREGRWSGNPWSPTTEESGYAPPTYPPPPLPPDPYRDRTYLFTFWSVNSSGAIGTPLRAVHGETFSIGGGPWTLNAKAWYVWDRISGEGGDGPGEHGVEIDAFNWTTNDFIPDYFVDISPDGAPDPSHADLGPLTYTANENGYVSTEKLDDPITIKARGEFRDRYYHYRFSHWQVINRFTSGSPMPVVNGSTITIHPRTSMKAYAIYDQVAADITEVEDVLRPFVLVAQANGLPLVVIPPYGGRPLVQPYGPDDLRQIVEFLHRIENDLHKIYDF